MSKLVLKPSIGGSTTTTNGVVSLSAPDTESNVDLILPATSGIIGLASHSKVYKVSGKYERNNNIYLQVANVDFTETNLIEGFRLILRVTEDVSFSTDEGSIYLDFFGESSSTKYKLFNDAVAVRKIFANTFLDIILTLESEIVEERQTNVYHWNVITSNVDGLPSSVVTSVSAIEFDSTLYDLLRIGSATRPPTEEEPEGKEIYWNVPVVKVSGTIPSALISNNDPRLSDARTPVAHTHSADDVIVSTSATLREELADIRETKADAYWADPQKTVQTLADNFLIDCGTLE